MQDGGRSKRHDTITGVDRVRPWGRWSRLGEIGLSGCTVRLTVQLHHEGGEVADCRAADVLLDDRASRAIVLADKPVASAVETAYDTNAIVDLSS